MKRVIWCGVMLLVVGALIAGMVGGWMLLRIKRQRSDLELALPPVVAQGSSAPLFLQIDEAGSISVSAGLDRKKFDRGDADRGLPGCQQFITEYAGAVRDRGEVPAVQIHVDGGVRHERVVDVLNVLSQAEIEKVTFVDLIDVEE